MGFHLILQSTPRKDSSPHLFTYASALILLIWMFPHHKVFDLSLSIFQMGILSYLMFKPVPARHILAGAGVGIAFFWQKSWAIWSCSKPRLDLLSSLEKFIRPQLPESFGPVVGRFCHWSHTCHSNSFFRARLRCGVLGQLFIIV